MDLLSALNEEQRLAVTQSAGPMLILAGAGSGKTRAITYKIAYLIDRKICRPEQILAVTFTNKAAEEMRVRVERLLVSLPAAPLISTFHSFAVRVLRKNAQRLGYSPSFTICDTDDQKSVLKAVYEQLNVTDSQLPIRRSQAVISRAKNKSWSPEEYLAKSRDFDAPDISRIYSAYQRYLEQSNGMDFDDLILLTVQLFRDHPDVREYYGNRFQYLLIDEYQDTNLPQYELIRHLVCLHQNVTAVGDEDQSIYGFRGADIRNILQFESDFPGAIVVKLEQNYRSTQNILDAAINVVSHNLNRKGKVLWTEKRAGEPIDLYVAWNAEAEALFVSYRIYQHLQEGDSHMGVLYRTNFQSRQFEEALRRLQIPYKVVGGVSFYNRKEIKDALAYLRVVQNRHDNVSLLRVINEPSRGIGRVTLARLHQIAREHQSSLWQAILTSLEKNSFTGRTHLALERFINLIQNCEEYLELPLHLSLEKVVQASGYIDVLQAEDTEEAHNRILNIRELVSAAQEHAEGGGMLQDFLDNAALRSEADEYDESAPVSLMTLHNAKGLEFPVVFLVGCEEGLFPHSRSIEEADLEEERRLCYVGMTRARKRLYLSYSRTRRFYGRDTFEKNQPSRFLHEIPESLLRVSSETPVSKSSGVDYHVTRRSTFSGKTYDSTESVRQFLQCRVKTKDAHKGFVSGAKIFHDQYGAGRILQVESAGDDLKVTVQFPGIGIKKMLQSYAKLKLV